MMNQKPMRWLDLAWRSGVIAVIYLAAQILVNNLLISQQPASQPGAQSEFYVMEAICGLALALAVGLLTLQLRTTRLRHAVIWAFILIFNAASLIIEGTFYSPVLVGRVWVQRIAASLVASLAAGGAVWWLLPLTPGDGSLHPVKPRSWFSWGWRFIVSSLTYLATYLVFGALNYALVTKPYYDAHAGGLTVPRDPQIILMAESARAPMIVLAVVPLVLTISHAGTRRRAALAAGLILFVIGGVLPLLPVTSLPLFLRVASLWEIFLQNFVTGLVIGALMGYAPQPAAASEGASLRPSAAR